MKLRYITCSDPREHNHISEIINLGRMPNAEIAVQCHLEKMKHGQPRNVWFEKLLHQLYNVKPMNLAIHVNKEWAADICCNGKIPDVLLEWIKIRNTQNDPIIKRIQLNIPEDAVNYVDPYKIAQIIRDFNRREFIFQYNDSTKDAIKKIHQTGAKFSLLFDESKGNGKSPEMWQKPVYETHPMGYAGGISPDNVIKNLRQINAVVKNDSKIWIDAEGRLQSNTLFDEKPKFDVQLARLYVARANSWMKQR